MNLVILTTDTLHHVRFVQEVGKAFEVKRVIVETRPLAPTFDVSHPFQLARDAHERATWFGGEHKTLQTVDNAMWVDRIHESAAHRALEECKPDVVLTFGTNKIPRRMIDLCPQGFVNLHGGDPQEYRGLDSHLWAIYHRDFAALVTTLHRIAPELDTGDIVLQAPLPLRPCMPLCELRERNTNVCIELSLSALDMMDRHGRFIAFQQTRRGRYYSFMPSCLKELCKARFEKHTSSL